jgi:hypothetical protein
MFRNLLLMFVETIILLVELSVSGTMLVKDYGVRVWKNNAMRKWVFRVIDRADARFHRFIMYLEEIESRLQCRIVYANISRPMKETYRDLAGRRFLTDRLISMGINRQRYRRG